MSHLNAPNRKFFVIRERLNLGGKTASEAPKVSVIVPIYKTEAYLNRCVDSLLRQTLREIEVILVDDGSPDRSGEIADERAQVDGRIKVIHQNNQGLGPARNSGISAARGKYLAFVDSDDWVDPDFLRLLYDAAEANGADMVSGGYKVVRNGVVQSVVKQPLAGSVLRGADEVSQYRLAFYGASPCKEVDERTPVSVWVSLYSARLLAETGVEFDNIRSEDKVFNARLARCARVVAIVSSEGYCYRKDGQPSITNSFKETTVADFFDLFSILRRLAEEEGDRYRDEASVRVKRCVLDYSRVLMSRVVESDELLPKKKKLLGIVCNSDHVRWALQFYPYKKLPIQQRLFFLSLKHRAWWASFLLIELRKMVSSDRGGHDR